MSRQTLHEETFRSLAKRRQLIPGETYMVDPATGLVSCATVWLHGDVWFIDHFERAHPQYRDNYLRATHSSRARTTLFHDPVGAVG